MASKSLSNYLNATREIKDGEVGFEEFLQQEGGYLMAKPEGEGGSEKELWVGRGGKRLNVPQVKGLCMSCVRPH